MKMIKAIPTDYNGMRFDSRTEAYWAVFFAVLGISYIHEPERQARKVMKNEKSNSNQN